MQRAPFYPVHWRPRHALQQACVGDAGWPFTGQATLQPAAVEALMRANQPPGKSLMKGR